ncbi:MAG: flagellar filament capping protein FliD [Pseudomonas sp.]
MATISALGIGSGLDLNGLLDQLAAAERQKLAPISGQKSTQQAKISAFGRLGSALTQLQNATAKLAAPAQFQGVKSAQQGVALGVTAPAGAAPGAYRVEVAQLAQASSVASAGIGDKSVDLGAATVQLTLGSGAQIEVSVGADNSSLEDIRDAINQSDGGILASIVNDGGDTPYRLVLSAAATGTDAALADVDFGVLAGTLQLDEQTRVEARNAALKVNGIAVTSQSNRVAEAIEGVVLELREEGVTTLDIRRDNQGVGDAVKAFVGAYNNLQTVIKDIGGYDQSSGVAGRLLGNAALRAVQSQLRSALGAGGGEGSPFAQLGAIGISLELGGTLKLDEERLADIANANPAGLQSFFAGASGFAGRLGAALERLLADDGVIGNATSGLDKSIERLDEQYARVEKGIDATIARYRTQFAQLDKMIATMNSTSAYLTQQFDIMNAQLNRK